MSPAVLHKLLPFSRIVASREDESPRCQPVDVVCFPTSTSKRCVAGGEFAPLLAGQHSYVYSPTGSLKFVKLAMRAARCQVWQEVATACSLATPARKLFHSIDLSRAARNRELTNATFGDKCWAKNGREVVVRPNAHGAVPGPPLERSGNRR